jgi:putrescine aminotransferase
LTRCAACWAKFMASITPGDLKYSVGSARAAQKPIEAAMKIAKVIHGQIRIYRASKRFHGKTMGSLSMMGKADYRHADGHVMAGRSITSRLAMRMRWKNNLKFARRSVSASRAVMFEPIQGESGAIVPPDDFWPRVRAATKKYGVFSLRMKCKRVWVGPGSCGALNIGTSCLTF